MFGLPDLIAGEYTLLGALRYHQQTLLCLEECTEKFHDDTCLLGIVERCIPIVEAEEKRNPTLAQPTPALRSEAGGL